MRVSACAERPAQRAAVVLASLPASPRCLVSSQLPQWQSRARPRLRRGRRVDSGGLAPRSAPPRSEADPGARGVLRRQASEWLAPRARRNFSSLNGVFTRPRIPARVVTPCAKAGLALCGAGHEHPAVTRRPLRVAGVESKPENFAAGRNT